MLNSVETKSFLNRVLNVDRRIIFIAIFIAVVLPFFLPPVVAMKPTRWVKASYDLVEEAAQKGRPIAISFEFSAAAIAEIEPMAVAVMRHAFSRNVKIIGINLTATGTLIGASTMDKIAAEYGKVYGVDYVYLGYVPQYAIVIQKNGDNFRRTYKTEFRGTPIDDLPIFKGIRNYDDIHVVFCLAETAMVSYYIVWGVTAYNFNFVGGVTAVSAAQYYTYLQSGQMKGMLAGMKAAAEYEGLIGHPGDALRGMASQTWGHVAMIAFVVVGNIAYFVKRRSDRRENETGRKV